MADDVNTDGVRCLQRLRQRARDPEVIFACDFGIEKVAQLNRLIRSGPEVDVEPLPPVRRKRLTAAERATREAIDIPAALPEGAKEAIQSETDRKAYMREYMRKKRAEKRGYE